MKKNKFTRSSKIVLKVLIPIKEEKRKRDSASFLNFDVHQYFSVFKNKNKKIWLVLLYAFRVINHQIKF